MHHLHLHNPGNPDVQYPDKPMEKRSTAINFKITARQGFAVLYHKAPASARGFIARLSAKSNELPANRENINQLSYKLPFMKGPEMPLIDTAPFDSRETQQAYHLARIQQLESALNELNLLENPCEIEIICKQIIAIKELLRKITPVTE